MSLFLILHKVIHQISELQYICTLKIFPLESCSERQIMNHETCVNIIFLIRVENMGQRNLFNYSGSGQTASDKSFDGFIWVLRVYFLIDLYYF